MTAVDRPDNGHDEGRPVSAPDCPVDRRDCDGPGTYRCDEVVWGSRCRAWQARNGGYAAPDGVEVAEPTPAEGLARSFHDAYERLAPRHGYHTREASAKPWSQVPVRNRRLMIAVADELLALLPPDQVPHPPTDATEPCPSRSHGVDGWHCAATGEHTTHTNGAREVTW